jgi:hypothetical protein
LFIGLLICALGAVLSDAGRTLSATEFSWLARICCSVSALAASGLTFFNGSGSAMTRGLLMAVAMWLVVANWSSHGAEIALVGADWAWLERLAMVLRRPAYGIDHEAYNTYCKNYLRELLSGHGEISEVWLDGASPHQRRQQYDYPGYYGLIRELQPTVVISIKGPDVRWVGNEAGQAREREWSVSPLPTPPEQYDWPDPPDTPPKVTIEHLLKNKEQWKSKRVEVHGFYMSRFEVSALYDHETDAREANDAKGLWIDSRIRPGCEDKVKWVNTGFIRVIGRFEFRPGRGSGHLGQWPAHLAEIELFEETSEPVRVPKR